MSAIMLKKFTLDKREDHKTSDTAGTVEFTITDELGTTRKISGTTFLDENMRPQGITSENKRELPLIEGLFRLELDESIEIEFEHYNKSFDRDSNKTVNQIAYEKVLQMQKEDKLLYKILSFFKRFTPQSSNEKQLDS